MATATAVTDIKKTLQNWCFNTDIKVPYNNLTTHIKGVYKGITIITDLTPNYNIPPYFEYPTQSENIRIYIQHLCIAIEKEFVSEKKPTVFISSILNEFVHKALTHKKDDITYYFKSSSTPPHPQQEDTLRKITKVTILKFLNTVQEDLSNQKTFAQLCKDYPNKPLSLELKQKIKHLSNKIKDLSGFQANPYLVIPEAPIPILDAFSKAYDISQTKRALGSLMSHLLKHYQLNGHTCYPVSKLLKEATYQTTHIDLKNPNNFTQSLETKEATEIFETIEDSDNSTDYLYIKSIYEKEVAIAKQLQNINHAKTNLYDPLIINTHISDYEQKHHLTFTDEQKEAISSIFTLTDILVITGYPGTGKSMVTNAIKYIYEELHPSTSQNTSDPPILFTAPTGIAATRLGKGKGMTLHRALKVALDERKEFVYRKNAQNPFTNNMIIIDEVSMLDMDIAHRFLSAFQPGKTKLILIGDENQLQSVGPGDILYHIIRSHTIKTVHLKKIFRQENTNKIHPITDLARTIIRGKMPTKQQLINDNVTFISLNTPESIYNKVLELFSTHLKEDCQIIFPTKKETTVGTIECNKIIAASKLSISSKSKFNQGDKVVCTKNTIITNEEGEVMNDLSVFNGEIGKIINIDSKSSKITFMTNSHKKITIKSDSLDHGWCITCNKAQGSEYNHVILVLHESQTIMLNRQLLYTAITRAKQHLYIIATASTLKKCIETPITRRYSFLSSFLVDE